MGLFQESEKVRLIKAYRRLFATEEGLEVLHDLAKSCHVYTTTIDPNSNEMAFKEGARSVILRIMRTLEQDPFALERMFKKQNNRDD